jgi:hypothetical protein
LAAGPWGQAKGIINNIVPGGLAGIDKLANTPMGKTMGAILAGARLDFPYVWKNSSYTPTYNFTIRLYNPNPKSKWATRKYIIGPLAALLLLALPITDEGSVYRWPFIHKIVCPGIFELKAACISNITVVKGGDQNQIGFNQRLAMVDVRFEIGSLYRSVLAGKDTKEMDEKRPTLTNYLKNLEDENTIKGTKDPRDSARGLTRPTAPKINPGIARKAAAALEIGTRAANRVNNIRLSVTNNLQPSMPNIISTGTSLIND